jgi:hypothetical protein
LNLIPVDLSLIDTDYARTCCRQLESGDILLLEATPFIPAEADQQFLRSLKQTSSGFFKNIAYKPNLGKTTGLESRSEEEAVRLHAIMESYSKGALDFLSTLVAPYARTWKVDYATFRPVEEQGRALPLKHRNDVMHVDSFPTRPTNGGRILRCFTNIHPNRPRVWETSDGFEALAVRFAMEAGLSHVTTPVAQAKRVLGRIAGRIGVKGLDRPPYDEFMLGFHHYLKANDDFQKTGVAHEFSFPPGSSWISFTDQIAHRAKSGQYALEQTCIIPYDAMLEPSRAPVAVLERLAGKTLRQ